MSVQNLIEKLQKVRGRNGRWMACCPAHPDKSPSLSIRELEDGRILVHCFSGCDVGSVVRAVGMQIEDLFPPRGEAGEFSRPVKNPVSAMDVLRVLNFEALVLMMFAHDIAQGEIPSDSDRARAELARERIEEASRYAGI